MNTAKVLANWYSQSGDSHCHAGIYRDGAIAYLAITEHTRGLIECDLGTLLAESARSDDGMFVAMVVQSPHWDAAFNVINGYMTDDLTVTDNRDKDHDEIAVFAAMIASVMARQK